MDKGAWQATVHEVPKSWTKRSSRNKKAPALQQLCPCPPHPPMFSQHSSEGKGEKHASPKKKKKSHTRVAGCSGPRLLAVIQDSSPPHNPLHPEG